MKFTAIATVFAAIAGATALATPPPTYETTSPLGWEVEIFPNMTMLLNGTLEEVRQQALAINPDWVDDDFTAAQEQFKRALLGYSDDEKRGLDPADHPHVLDKRSVFDADRVTCGGSWEEVEWMDAIRRNAYLISHKGTPKIGAGPGECSRVSCAYDTGIKWCNDNKKALTLNAWTDVAAGATAVINKCRDQKHGSTDKVSGQAFHVDNWNVIVYKDDC